MKNILIAVAALLVATSAFAEGNGSAGSGAGGAGNAGGPGAGYGGSSENLGYFPGWQTASPAEREAYASTLPPAPKMAGPEPLKFPAWVHASN